MIEDVAAAADAARRGIDARAIDELVVAGAAERAAALSRQPDRQCPALRPHVWVGVLPVEDGIDILIDDDGPGIPAAERERVFQPFIRLDTSRNPSTGGVGLGLTIARDVARSHGGDVTARNLAAGRPARPRAPAALNRTEISGYRPAPTN